jgi:release factor glutamine methyltransferase
MVVVEASGQVVAASRTLGMALRQLAARFREAGLPEPEIDTRYLVAAATGATRSELITQSDRHLLPQHEQLLAEFQQRRLAREPVSRILGTREFYGHRFMISPAVLDPRADSETLIDAVLAAIDANASGRQRAWSILDLGTGSGCLLLSLLHDLPNSDGTGLDKSTAALDIARINAAALGLTDRSSFVAGDFADAAGLGSFDIVISNPPYIDSATIAELEPEVKDYDPRLALDGGLDGLDAYRAILKNASNVRRGGFMAFEIGIGAASAVAELMGQAGFNGIDIRNDLAGVPRVVLARALLPTIEHRLDHG